jgi:hypothetical protein
MHGQVSLECHRGGGSTEHRQHERPKINRGASELVQYPQ